MEDVKIIHMKTWNADDLLFYNDEWYFTPNCGTYYKNIDIYDENLDAMCYAPEGCIEIEDPDLYVKVDGENDLLPFFSANGGYSHRELLEIFYSNEKFCDAVFGGCTLTGRAPETILDEGLDHDDLVDFWDFVKPGAKVKHEGVLCYVTRVPDREEWNEETTVDLREDGGGLRYIRNEVYLTDLIKVKK